MAEYTMELREYIESFSQDTIDSLTTDQIIENGRTKLFDFAYPLYDSSYKTTFETNFIRNFYMREIGFETEGLFKMRLQNWLNLNMPYWNQMYESESLSYNPLENSNRTNTHTKTNDKTENGTNDTTVSGSSNNTKNTTTNQTNDTTTSENNFDRLLESNNPDSRLEITATNGTGVIEYASSIEENSVTNSGTNNETINGTVSDTSSVNQSGTNNTTINNTIDETETFNQSSSGKIGVQTYPEMIQKHRDIFLRIDKMIFEEMQELFMLLY